MDNILELLTIPSARGRQPAQLSLVTLRPLNEGDVEAILKPPPLGATTPMIAKLRSSHQALARQLAEGHSQRECALITGYSESRISILQGDPAFAELVAYYKSQKDEIYLDVHQRLAALGMDSIEELQERLSTDPDAFSNKSLMDLAELCLDRSLTAKTNPRAQGGGGVTTVNVNFVSPGEVDINMLDITPAK